jgi:hypothetical protein
MKKIVLGLVLGLSMTSCYAITGGRGLFESYYKEKFKKNRFADPKVQEAADKGHCLTCLKLGHFARQCKIQPPTKHERLR